jgi:hypothetical protein
MKSEQWGLVSSTHFLKPLCLYYYNNDDINSKKIDLSVKN